MEKATPCATRLTDCDVRPIAAPPEIALSNKGKRLTPSSSNVRLGSPSVPLLRSPAQPAWNMAQSDKAAPITNISPRPRDKYFEILFAMGDRP